MNSILYFTDPVCKILTASVKYQCKVGNAFKQIFLILFVQHQDIKCGYLVKYNKKRILYTYFAHILSKNTGL